MSAPWRFRACGLSIHSDVPIHGLRPHDCTAPPDVQVRMRGTINPPDLDDDAAPLWYRSPYSDERQVPLLTIHALGSSYVLSYAEGARFLVNVSGAEVDAWWEPPLNEVDAADYLLGSVLAFVLRLRGAVPLHASAVVIGERAVLFAGSPGAGKSSTAAAFALLGYPVLSDDIVAIADQGGVMMAHPSSGHLSVWPDSARALFATESLPRHSAVYAKHRVDLTERGYRFHESAVPIDTICVLAGRSATSSAVSCEVSPRAALMALVGQTYSNYLLDASMRAREFDLLGRVAETVSVKELAFSDRFEDLVPSCRTLALEFGNGVGTHFSKTVK